MKIKSYLSRILALVALLVCPMMAQLDPGVFQIYQNGVQVGEIYVPDRAAGQTLYEEHWVLYSNYVYASPKNKVRTEIVASLRQTYTSETDFFMHVSWGTGFRYVHVTSTDTSILPGVSAPRPITPCV